MPTALISLTDKTGIVYFASGLAKLGYRILSTGGTAKLLIDEGISAVEVSELTGFPEIMDGRVKTLHPKIHGGILMDRSNSTHLKEAKANDIQAIDLVVVNLYDFEKEVLSKSYTKPMPLEDAIKYVDIGGPTLLRAAAKNFQYCGSVIDPQDYQRVLKELQDLGGLPLETRIYLAQKTFAKIHAYDQMISSYFARFSRDTKNRPPTSQSLNKNIEITLDELQSLRYGENPHQAAGFYIDSRLPRHGLGNHNLIQGKELSFNNILDLDAGAGLVSEFSHINACAIIKHNNPCGIALDDSSAQLSLCFESALQCDPTSAFGGIIAFNQNVDAETADAITEHFFECVIAPSFDSKSLDIFSRKKNLRIVGINLDDYRSIRPQIRSVCGAYLVQIPDHIASDQQSWKAVTKKSPTEDELSDLALARIVAKHVKSNAIVLATHRRCVGIGAGQMSRIDAANIAFSKIVTSLKKGQHLVLASDAFFPFRDTVDLASKHGVTAIIQPGGSIRDQESIDACDEHGISMVLTSLRNFRH